MNPHTSSLSVDMEKYRELKLTQVSEIHELDY